MKKFILTIILAAMFSIAAQSQNLTTGYTQTLVCEQDKKQTNIINYYTLNSNNDTLSIAHRTKSGKKTGVWILCTDSTVVAILHYKNNKRCGVWYFYNEVNELVQVLDYTKNRRKKIMYRRWNESLYAIHYSRLVY